MVVSCVYMDDKNIHDPHMLRQAVERVGSIKGAARELGIPETTFRRWLNRSPNIDDKKCRPGITDQTNQDHRVLTARGAQVRTVDDLLERAGVRRDDWIIERQLVNSWDAMAKQDDGTSCPETMYQVKVWLAHREAYTFEPVEWLSKPRKAPEPTDGEDETILCIPDAQFGFRRLPDGELEPFHDVEALKVALSVATHLQPDTVVLMGDMLDFPELSRFQSEPNTRQLIQPSLDALGMYLQKLVEAVPDARICWLEGNHELRLRNALLDLHAGALADVRPANDDGAPALSVERLLHLSELGIEYIAPYGTPLWLGDVMLHHGHVVRGSAKTMAAILSNATHHHVVGHIHRREIASRSIQTPEGRKEVHAMSPGCLASVKRGGVPAGKGRPGVDWQQGLGVIYRIQGMSHMHLIPVLGGCAVFDGKRFCA